MSQVQIPNLPAVAAVSGADLVEAVQAGVSVKQSLAQIAAYVVTTYPYPFPENPIQVVHGGTGDVTFTQYGLIYGNGVSPLGGTAAGITGQVLIGNTGAAPSWGTISATLVSSISFGTTGLTPNSPTTGDIVVAGTLTVANGGTGQTSLAIHGVLLGNGTSGVTVTAVGTTGQVLIGNTGADPSWANATSVSVTSISFGTTGLTPNTGTQGAVTVAGTLIAANGGTGFASYAVGDILYANTTTTLAKLADVATGNVLLSGGIGTAPSWGKVSLTAAVSGILPVANGGSGAGTFTAHGILLGNGTGAFAVTAAGTTGQILVGSTGADPIWIAAGTTGQVLIGNTGASPSWAALTGQAVTSISFGTTGLTPNSATQGAVVVAGTLSAANGGTGVANAAGSTITLGGALAFSGAFTSTFTVTANTSVTLPTTGTLATLAGAEALTNKTITTFGGALTFNPANANFTLSPTGTGTGTINPATAGTINNMVIGGSTPLAGTFTTVSDSVGNVRSIIHSGSDKVTGYTLATTDNGQYVSLGASGAIVIPNSTFADGNVVTVFNNTSSGATITCNTTTAYAAGTDSNKGGGGTLTLATRGVATILFLGSTSCVISGNVA